MKTLKNKPESRSVWLIFLVGGLLIINLVFLGYFYFREKEDIQGRQFLTLSPSETNLSGQEGRLKIIFLDVGQGDAILIRTPEKKNILIDGGPDKNIIYKLDQYLPFYERKIDLLILTHPDPDHLNGLVEILKRYQVGQVFYNGVKDEDLTYQEFLREIEENKIKKEIIWLGRNFIFDNLYLETLFPFENLIGQKFKNDNEASLVLKLTFGQIKILLTGDATKKVEEKLIKNNLDLKADLLKVAHHGSKDSTSLEFLEKVQPTYAVISVGKNKYGHPSLRVLRNLEKIKTQILRTDQLGDIIFEINQHNASLQIRCQFTNCHK
ncbi:MAG: MBL fold metallo-hydrolase [Patescibacteria group bacterium]|nr:MBL fold metallo-hydrolase [Patescibacteria group bacterium]